MTRHDAVRLLRPDAQLSHTPALGCYTLLPAGGIATWQCGGTAPTPEELAGAESRLSAAAELPAVRAMLDERYQLFGRALARGDSASQAEIQGEIQSILAYIQEVEHATRLA